jgi:hypothetical protein
MKIISCKVGDILVKCKNYGGVGLNRTLLQGEICYGMIKLAVHSCPK